MPSSEPHPLLEAALRPYLRDDFFFVNVGASDGVSNDPIYPFVRKFGWTGLLIEPVPHVFELLRTNYAAFRGMRFENALVSATPRRFHCLPEEYCRDRPWARQIGSVDPERIRWALAYIATERPFADVVAGVDDLDRITSCAPPSATLTEILARHRVEAFDVINLDTEGTDLEILESIDLVRYGVRAAIVETWPHGHDDAIAALLAAQGFAHVATIDWATDAFVRRP